MKEFKKFNQKAHQIRGYDSSDEDDGHHHPESRHRISTRRRRANGNGEADHQPVNSTELPSHANAAAEMLMATQRVSEIHPRYFCFV